MVDHRFTREARLRTREDFARVFRGDAYAADLTLVVRGCRNGLQRPRLGLAIGRRVGSAVVRNRWKRLIREVFRTRRHEFPFGMDIVVRPRKDAQPSYEAIDGSLPALARALQRRLPPTRHDQKDAP